MRKKRKLGVKVLLGSYMDSCLSEFYKVKNDAIKVKNDAIKKASEDLIGSDASSKRFCSPCKLCLARIDSIEDMLTDKGVPEANDLGVSLDVYSRINLLLQRILPISSDGEVN